MSRTLALAIMSNDVAGTNSLADLAVGNPRQARAGVVVRDGFREPCFRKSLCAPRAVPSPALARSLCSACRIFNGAIELPQQQQRESSTCLHHVGSGGSQATLPDGYAARVTA